MARPGAPLLLLAAALGVCAFYYLGAGRESPAPAPAPRRLHLLMMFTKAARSSALQARGQAALRSLLRHARLEPGQALHLHFVSEPRSRQIAQGLLRPLLPGLPFPCQVIFHDVDVLTEQLFPVVEAMQKHFSAGSGSYYSDSIFFLSVAMHRIMPTEIERIIQVDLDLKYKTNIRELFEEFDHFPQGAVIGIAREMQPVYRYGSGPGTQQRWGDSSWRPCAVLAGRLTLQSNVQRSRTRSGSSAVRTPRARWANPLLTACLALTAGSCC
ncbi:xyloside xylosyltransferase 1 isoform X2 [Mauremys reevesii]|uniref:xyloside xylosyltransferase 1 isoform X2 n=1 Tax=Mauremys reevesii TaxID=260615 RepID=UPI00193FD12A|nr:xyloside xylosyltransferase 1 isoform X2 [Mauremys reevesii]